VDGETGAGAEQFGGGGTQAFKDAGAAWARAHQGYADFILSDPGVTDL
jgi:hypothetical protein